MAKPRSGPVKPAPTKKTASKKPATPKKTDPVAPPAKAASNAEDTYEPNKDRHALLELVARNGPVDDRHRAAFDTLQDDDSRSELGGRTKAVGVLSDAVKYAVIMDQTFRDYGSALEAFYSRQRFSYYLDRAAALGAAIAAQEARRGGQDDSRSTTESREEALKEVRDALAFRLGRVAGARGPERKSIAEAKGRADDEKTLGKAVQDLVALGRSWLERKDSITVTLVESASLTPKLLDEAIASAEALTGSAKDTLLTGRRRGVDAPDVNLVEGTVLGEMQEAMICFDAGNKATKMIPRLTPGRATRHVLGPRTSSKKSPPEPVVVK